MSSLFLKDEDLQASPPILAYKILYFMESRNVNRISIFDVSEKFKKEKWFSLRNLYFAMMFLFSLGIIEFEQAYIIKNDDN